MHWFHVVTLFVVNALIGVEFCVAAFLYPAAKRLDAEPQLQVLSRVAVVLGRVMPVWYPVCGVLLLAETWVLWRVSGRGLLLAADAIWVLASLASVVFLVPLNNRIAAGAADWQVSQRLWERRHRARTAALAVAALLVTFVLGR